ncbi:MAG: hypothetical protein ABIQ16_15300 [Polyangiaceae bacterium]
MKLMHTTVLLGLWSLTACSAPSACPAYSSSYDNLRYSSPVTGTTELSRAGETNAFALKARFDHLPQLWPSNGAISAAQLSLGVSARYESDPQGGDGKTQMPRFSATVDGIPTGTTGSFPGPNSGVFSIEFRAECTTDSEVDCCPFGATECERILRVVLTRIDGEPFPPVRLSWSAGASAQLSACPGSASDASLTLSSEAR